MVETIPHIFHRHDALGFGFQFLAELSDVHVHRTGFDIHGLIIAPHALKQELA